MGVLPQLQSAPARASLRAGEAAVTQLEDDGMSHMTRLRAGKTSPFCRVPVRGSNHGQMRKKGQNPTVTRGGERDALGYPGGEAQHRAGKLVSTWQCCVPSSALTTIISS